MTIIDSGLRGLRDPCVLYENGTYYLYASGWVCYYGPSLQGPWTGPVQVTDFPKGHPSDGGNHWAPEVHRYNGSYYMFTTYKSSETGHRGSVIFKAETPLGPFCDIAPGLYTPKDWDTIDATFYIEDGAPWMVFVHEWTSTPDHVGRMAAAKLSPDLSHFVSEPIELFHADEPVWARSGVTDGCWMYRTKKGSLLMLWSNFDEDGYCEAIARSASGKIIGPWTHEENRLYAKSISGMYDGGHGMVFTAADGRLYLSLHSPNSAKAGRPETPVFIPLKEENDTLVAE